MCCQGTQQYKWPADYLTPLIHTARVWTAQVRLKPENARVFTLVEEYVCVKAPLYLRIQCYNIWVAGRYTIKLFYTRTARSAPRRPYVHARAHVLGVARTHVCPTKHEM